MVNSTNHDGWAFKGSGAAWSRQVRFQPDAEGLLHLAKLEMSDECTPTIEQEQLEAAMSAGESTDDGFQTQQFVCCTHCHHAASSPSQSSTLRAISIAMAACIACHD
jgi:hypothetical protein